MHQNRNQLSFCHPECPFPAENHSIMTGIVILSASEGSRRHPRGCEILPPYGHQRNDKRVKEIRHWWQNLNDSKKLFWISPKNFSWLDVSVFVCALGDFLVLSAPVLRQIARYLPHHTSENASKTHPKSAHDKFKTASYSQKEMVCELDKRNLRVRSDSNSSL